jgi:hypothetical protein
VVRPPRLEHVTFWFVANNQLTFKHLVAGALVDRRLPLLPVINFDCPARSVRVTMRNASMQGVGTKTARLIYRWDISTLAVTYAGAYTFRLGEWVNRARRISTYSG